MIDMAIGVAIGAIFAPFWMMVWNKMKTMFQPATVAKVEADVTVAQDVVNPK